MINRWIEKLCGALVVDYSIFSATYLLTQFSNSLFLPFLPQIWFSPIKSLISYESLHISRCSDWPHFSISYTRCVERGGGGKHWTEHRTLIITKKAGIERREFWPEPMKFLVDMLNHSHWLRIRNTSMYGSLQHYFGNNTTERCT